MGVIVVLLVVILAVAGVVYASNNEKKEVAREQQVPENVAVRNETDANETTETTNTYQDGTYSVVGEYQSPGGSESIDVTLTLQDGIITDANVISNAERPTSVKMQGQFISGYQAEVIGKNIDDVQLDVVSGSSLTPKGFNDAVEKIKQQAQV